MRSPCFKLIIVSFTHALNICTNCCQAPTFSLFLFYCHLRTCVLPKLAWNWIAFVIVLCTLWFKLLQLTWKLGGVGYLASWLLNWMMLKAKWRFCVCCSNFMLVKKSLCIAMVAISLGRNPKCKESDISKRSGSSWYYFGNNLMYDDMLYQCFYKMQWSLFLHFMEAVVNQQSLQIVQKWNRCDVMGLSTIQKLLLLASSLHMEWLLIPWTIHYCLREITAMFCLKCLWRWWGRLANYNTYNNSWKQIGKANVHHCKFGLSKDVHILRLYALPLEELSINMAKALFKQK